MASLARDMDNRAAAAGRLEIAAGRLFAGAVFLLPVVFWPGIELPFSTPKLWLLAVVGTAAAVSALVRRGPITPHWAWLLWIGALGASAAFGRSVSFEATVLALAPVALYAAARQGPADGIERALRWSAAVESAIVILQYAHLDPMLVLGWQPERFGTERMRVYGTLGNPDFAAAWLCATLPLQAGAVAGAQREKWKYGSIFALQLAAILATGSRVFLIALPAIVVVFALLRGRAARWWLAGLPVAAALLWLSPARPLATTIEGRLHLVRVAAPHWLEVPLTGYGPGGFRIEFAPWQIKWFREHGAGQGARFAGPVDHAHNDYLEFWFEYGPIGFCALAGLGAWLIWTARQRRANAAAWSGLACLAAIALVDFPFHRPAEWGLLWILLALVRAEKDIH